MLRLRDIVKRDMGELNLEDKDTQDRTYWWQHTIIDTHYMSQNLVHLVDRFRIIIFNFYILYYKHCAITITYILFGNLSLFASYAMLMRLKKAEPAVHGC